VTSIETGAFSTCINLSKITIPESVTDIGKLAFGECYCVTIRCKADSAAESYAKENEIPYENY